MRNTLYLAIAAAVAFHAGSSFGADSAEETQKLGSTLTPFGAKVAGSTDGAIPEYTGGLTEPPAGFDPKSGHWPDPFANENSVVKITAQNASQYSEFLTPGAKALLSRYPTYRVDVYPTHRTMHYPKWVLDNSVKNATTAKLTGKTEGDGVEDASGGIPFPIPKNGYEVMWNNYLAFQRTQFSLQNVGSYLVDTSGARTTLPVYNQEDYHPYYDRDLKSLPKGSFELIAVSETAPPTVAGTAILSDNPINYSERDAQTWLYMPGQRRIRMAPEYKYDTPAAQYGGVMFWDELQLYHGQMDRFDFKLVGKKELIIPYNNYRYYLTPENSLYGPKHLNPDDIRWEKHRVWVVEATLKADARHAYSKRVFYFDEDSWALVEADGYDQDGKLWRIGLNYSFNYYDGNGGVFLSMVNFYDLQKGNYFSGVNALGGVPPMIKVSDQHTKAEMFTPAGLSGSGIR